MECSNSSHQPIKADSRPSVVEDLRRSGGPAGTPGPTERTSGEGSAACLLNRRGLALETAQRFTEAEQIYRTALRTDPHYLDTYLNLAALICRRADRGDEAIALCRQALQLKPDWVNVYILLGCIYQSRLAWDQAEACHLKALEIAPDLTEAHQNLGLIMAATQRHRQAVDHFRRALTRRPGCARTWNDLGISLRACGLLREAVGAYCSAIECRPDLAIAWYHKGNVLQDLKYDDEASVAYRRALELDDHLPDAWNNLGVVLRGMNLPEQAAEAFGKAIEQDPETAEAHNNLGLTLALLGQPEAAVESYLRALALNPGFAEACRNLADSLKELRQTETAVSYYRQAVRLRPDYASAWWNLSLALLQSGQLREGFRLYHYRRRPELKIFTYPHNLDAPRWDGSPFQDKTLLIYCEQGLGDSIQFSRYLPAVRQRGGRVILEAPPALVRLFTSSALADDVIASGTEKPSVHYDLCGSVMDLPDIFETTLQTIPNETPYLAANPQDIRRWQGRIGQKGYKIGIAWAGNPKHGNDKRRSIDAEMFATLNGLHPDIRFFSLQLGDAGSAVERLSKSMAIENLSDGLTDLAETAAAMACLDLVISVDTSVAHLAGALGRTAWTLLPYCADWRWLLHRDDSPWYPGMQLFRQRQRGNWSEVFSELRQELAHACLSGRVRRLL